LKLKCNINKNFEKKKFGKLLKLNSIKYPLPEYNKIAIKEITRIPPCHPQNPGGVYHN